MQRAAQSSMSPQSLTASNVLLANQARLYQAVGSPTSTESSGFKDLLIWQCSDGTITVEAERVVSVKLRSFGARELARKVLILG
jgi:hypothetical protein